MATIQVVIDDELLRRLDGELQGAQRGRSALIRRAIEQELERLERARLDEQDRLAYLEPETREERAEREAWGKLSGKVWAGETQEERHSEPR